MLKVAEGVSAFLYFIHFYYSSVSGFVENTKSKVSAYLCDRPLSLLARSESSPKPCSWKTYMTFILASCLDHLAGAELVFGVWVVRRGNVQTGTCHPRVELWGVNTSVG